MEKCVMCEKEFEPTKEEIDFLKKIQESNYQIDETGVERKVFNLVCSECYNKPPSKIRIKVPKEYKCNY